MKTKCGKAATSGATLRALRLFQSSGRWRGREVELRQGSTMDVVSDRPVSVD